MRTARPAPARITLAAALLLAGSSVSLAAPQLLQKIAVVQPPGWDSPIVPRLTTGATIAGPLTTASALTSDSPVWFNWAVRANPSIGGYWVDKLLLDGDPIQRLPRWNGAFVFKDWYALDAGPVFVHGGRHTLSAITDEAVKFEDYTDRYDNRQDRQLLWTPEPATPNGVTGSFEAPPVPFVVSMPLPNNHAYSYTPGPTPWVVAMRPQLDYDLVLYDDFTGSTSGLSHEIGRSARPADSLEIVVGGPASATGAVYPTVSRKNGVGENSYFLSLADATGRLDTDGDAFWSAESLAANHMVQLFQIDLQGGHAYPVSLWRRVGLTPIHFAVFPADPALIGGLDQALVRSQPVAGQDYEVASFTPVSSGRYLVLAFRETSEAFPVRYQLAVGSNAVGVGPASAPALSFAAAPNPSNRESRLRYVLPAAGAVKLELLDLQGRVVRTLVNGVQEAGAHEEAWDLRAEHGGRVAAGLYWARLEAAGERRLTRLSVVR